MRIEEFLSRLESVKQSGSGYIALCPAHGDTHQSLSISRGDNGGIVCYCHVGCDTSNIVESMGLKMSDLMPEKTTGHAASSSPAATYLYTDIDGKLLARKFRCENKSFYWQHPDGTKGMPKVPLIYNAPALKADPIFIVEGEKDTDTMTRLSLSAVSPNNGASGSIPTVFNEHFKGKTVCIIPDNDKAGRDFAYKTAKQLHGIAKSLKVLDIKTAYPALQERGDISDVVYAEGQTRALELIFELQAATQEYEPGAESPDQTLPLVVKASEIPYEPPRWLLPPYFQKGKGTLIQGDNGSGKTAFMCAIAAHISTGRPLLGIPVETPGNVLIMSVEDDLPVLRGRIEANGGDLDKCHFIPSAAGLTFNSPEVEQVIAQVNAKLVIFDPFQAFLGANVRMSEPNQTRPEMAKLFEMAERNDCSVAIIAHMGKITGDKSPVNRSLGSVDIPASMRSILQLTKNPDNEAECIMVHVKCSNAPKGQSIAYTIGDRGGVSWTGFSPMTPDDLSVIVKRKEKAIPYEREPLVQVFNQLITDKPGGGFWSYEELKTTGMKILGFPPFSSTHDLRAKLDSSLTRELQERDGLIVTCGHRSKAQRGIRIEQYQHPQGYQTTLAAEGDACPV